MKIIVDKNVVEFVPIDEKLDGGQVSSIERTVFKKADGSLWRYKSSSVFQEFMGFVAYNALGIPTPKYDIGVIDDQEYDNPGALVFLQEYLPKAQQAGSDLLPTNSDELLNLIVASAILGDADGVGRAGDNVLLEKDGEMARLYKIDCAKIFEKVDNNWLVEAGHPWNNYFDQYVSERLKNKEAYFCDINSFLSAIKVDDFCNAMSAAYDKFRKLISQKKYLIKKCRQDEKFIGLFETELPEPIAFLRRRELNSIEVLCQKIKDNIIALSEITVRKSPPFPRAVSSQFFPVPVSILPLGVRNEQTPLLESSEKKAADKNASCCRCVLL